MKIMGKIKEKMDIFEEKSYVKNFLEHCQKSKKCQEGDFDERFEI